MTKKRKKVINRNMNIRSLNFETFNIDKENRTIDFCASTGAKVTRNRWYEEPIFEELEISERSVDLKRLNNGAPLLINHDVYSLRSQIGVIEKAWIENNKLFVRARFSKRNDVEPIYQDILDGIIRNVSIGYLINSFDRYKGENDQYETIRATSFTPYEVSLVPVPADPDAGIRSFDDNDYIPECILKDRNMLIKSKRALKSAEPEVTTLNTTARTEEPKVDLESERIKEQERTLEIISQCRRLNISDEISQKIIKETRTIEAAREKIINSINDNFEDKNKNMRHAPITSTGHDEKAFVRSGIENAIAHRIDSEELSENGRRFRSFSLIEICREFVPGSRDLGKSEIARRALATSDFPSLMMNVANKRLRKMYEQTPQTFRPLVREGVLSDFKPTTLIQTGLALELLEVPEGGKYEDAKFSDTHELYFLKTFGRILTVTRQMIINDDLNALSTYPASYGRAAANLESKVVWEQLTNRNLLMGDGKSLFHVDHKNIAATGSIISKKSLEQGELAFANQKGLENEDINLGAKYLVVPSTLKNIAKLAMSEIIATRMEDVNPYANAFEIIVDSRLDKFSKTGWYLVADPTQIDLIEIGYLAGEKGVKLSQDETFDVDAIRFKASLDFGAKVIDYRGFYYNPGA